MTSYKEIKDKSMTGIYSIYSESILGQSKLIISFPLHDHEYNDVCGRVSAYYFINTCQENYWKTGNEQGTE